MRAIWGVAVALMFNASPPALAEEVAITPIPDANWAGMNGKSWHANKGCPGRDDLRLVRPPFVDFEGKSRTGSLIVAEKVAAEVLDIFTELAKADYRIERMVLIDAYDGNDFASIEANNTSAFNCRATTGAKTLSQHGLGLAIDLNPLINPYVDKSGTSHAKSKPFDTLKERKTSKAPGMILDGDVVVKAFAKRGWKWGGNWKSLKDYQHFSKSGK
jgi:hypothetical protein